MACEVRYRTKSALVIWVPWQFMTQSRLLADLQVLYERFSLRTGRGAEQ